MMMNLFSSFDPSTNWHTSLNWISSLLWIIFIPSLFRLIPSRLNMLWMKIICTLHNEFQILIGKNFMGSTLIFISLFSLILMNIFLGLFLYIFTSTSHMTLTLSLALPLWLKFMIIFD